MVWHDHQDAGTHDHTAGSNARQLIVALAPDRDLPWLRGRSLLR
ncbi:MAG: hypothetical protein ACI8U3_002717 [Brevundimonas sp.]|jgi:hypothetical protein